MVEASSTEASLKGEGEGEEWAMALRSWGLLARCCELVRTWLKQRLT